MAGEPTSEAEGPIPADFDESAYLAAFPKIADNIRAGNLKSGLEHYLRKGVAEKRLEQPRYRKALAEQRLLVRLSAPPPSGETRAPVSVGRIGAVLDTLMVAPGGICLAIGWVDDRGADLSAISVQMPDGKQVRSANIARCRRIDAESATGGTDGHLLGFFALIELGQNAPPGPGSVVQLQCGSDSVNLPARPHLVMIEKLRDSIFEYLAASSFFGSHAIEVFLQLDSGIGDALLRLNRSLSAHIASRAHVERHGRHDRQFRASIVVCLFGRIEYLFLQAAAFSAAPGADDYEYVYVSNSPELTDSLQREARMAAKLYGLSFTLVILPGNAGFGAANNAAVAHAASDRVLIANPDVFPRDRAWPARHAALLDGLPAEQTRLFGAPLYYDDGALMHAGMFIVRETALSVRPDGIFSRDILRVEHYGKGAPPDTPRFLQSRRVPAVTGAFVSTTKQWFERIGGFSEDYVFGHYEDADLGLKSWQAGGQVWMHDFPLWHLEGKGSTRTAVHDGGTMINRWHFSRTWQAAMQDGFEGPDPARLRR